jgi:hypothetical protein
MIRPVKRLALVTAAAAGIVLGLAPPASARPAIGKIRVRWNVAPESSRRIAVTLQWDWCDRLHPPRAGARARYRESYLFRDADTGLVVRETFPERPPYALRNRRFGLKAQTCVRSTARRFTLGTRNRALYSITVSVRTPFGSATRKRYFRVTLGGTVILG